MTPRRTDDGADAALSFVKWLEAGREFVPQSELDALRERVIEHHRRIVTALESEGESAPTALANRSARATKAPKRGRAKQARERKPSTKRGGAPSTTSAFIIDFLRDHEGATGAEVVVGVQKAHPKITPPIIHAALFRLVASEKITKDGARGSYTYRIAGGADV